jgi:alpha-N-arabinofuranosidase
MFRFKIALLFASALLVVAPTIRAQAPLLVYSENLVNGFQNWSWATVDAASTATAHSGSHAISVTMGQAWQALFVRRNDFDVSRFQSLRFWIHGGTNGGQQIQVRGVVGGSEKTAFSLGTLPANTWKEFIVPLSSIGLANATNANGFWIQDRVGSAKPTFYVDDIELVAKPFPAAVPVTVDASKPIRKVDARWFGVNTAIWDGNFDSAATRSAITEMGLTTLRFPGGSASDEYHWSSNKSANNSGEWATSFAKFARNATNLGAQVFITANYGNGTPEEAAGWVRHSNVTNQFAFKYWEIGNENYGTWEADTNARPHDAWTYANRAKDYLAQMKAADPTIKVGVVIVDGEDSFVNGYTNHPATNPRTGQQHNGWTPVLLSTLKQLGVTPDFAVYHYYPQNGGGESDPFLLQTARNWERDVAGMRQMLADYFGAGHTNIELACTENNSVSSKPGKQSVSLVNALYLGESFGRLARTEMNALVWWDLRNGTDTSNNMDPSLYGWRSSGGQFYGDYGILNGATTRHPQFYAFKLLSEFARGGDTVVAADTGFELLSAHAVRRTNGALSLLVINQDASGTLTGQVTVTGFVPASAALVRSYGIPNDEAARLNRPLAEQDITSGSMTNAGSAFRYAFPPYSLTLITLTQAPPVIVQQPRSETVAAGAPLALTVVANGSTPLTYQWARNGSVLAGETNARWSIESAARADSGVYAVTVSNPGGSVVSSNAVARVVVPSRLEPPQGNGVGGYRLLLQGVDGLASSDVGGLEVQWRNELGSDPQAGWEPLAGDLVVTNGSLLINDPSAAGQSQRFYRTVER